MQFATPNIVETSFCVDFYITSPLPLDLHHCVRISAIEIFWTIVITLNDIMRWLIVRFVWMNRNYFHNVQYFLGDIANFVLRRILVTYISLASGMTHGKTASNNAKHIQFLGCTWTKLCCTETFDDGREVLDLMRVRLWSSCDQKRKLWNLCKNLTLYFY